MPRYSRVSCTESFFSHRMKSRSRSLAVPAAQSPAVPAPMMRSSVSSVRTMSPSATSGSSPSHAGAPLPD